MPLTNEILEKYGRGTTFIETGTQEGNGISKALQAGFSKVVSIEISEDWIEIAKSRLVISEAIKDNRVKIVKGNSAKKLGGVLRNIKEPSTLWLDAHTRSQSVIIKELKSIIQERHSQHTILIDDVDVMGNSNHRWGYNVRIKRIEKMLRRINSDYNIFYVSGERYRDILVTTFSAGNV